MRSVDSVDGRRLKSRPDRGTTTNVGAEKVLRVRAGERLPPRGRRQLQDAPLRPAGDEAEQVPQVRPGLDAVQLAAGQERHEGRVNFAGVVVADE
jgi:hypothetical protein